jgi:general secretion pathway protein K
VVIVVALFIVALVATMAYVMMARLARDTRRTELIVHDAQAGLYAQGSVLWAKDTLRNNLMNKKKDKLVDVLPIKAPVSTLNGYTITSTIKDAQGRFNLNNVTKPEWQSDFIRLIKFVYPKMSPEEAAAVVQATVDWVTPGARDNAFSRYYAELPVPYRPAHRLMVDPGELLLVKGVTPELYAALKPYITALPSVTPINVLSADVPVLALLSPDMSLDTAHSIRDLMMKSPPPTMEAFLALDIIKNHKVQVDHAALTSTYFLVETEVGIGRQHIMLYTLLQRATNNGKADLQVISQHRGLG